MIDAIYRGIGGYSAVAEVAALTHPPRPRSSRTGWVNAARMRKTPAASEVKSEEKISADAIREELSRVLESPLFVQSDRLGRFLRFTVETTLAGEAEVLKEYLIGTEVYDRKPPYHPSVDSIVRSEARRLRNKLKEYYESVGKDSPVFIHYRPGSYVPVFRHRHGQDKDPAATNITPLEPGGEGRAISVAVLPFVDASRSGGELSGICAQIITDELIHVLVRTEGFRVSAASSIAPLVAQALDPPSVARKLDLQIVFEGTVHEDNNQLRITSRAVSADGFLICSERFETEPDTPSFFKVSEKIASALISCVSPDQSVQNQKVEQRRAALKAPLRPRSMRKNRIDPDVSTELSITGLESKSARRSSCMRRPGLLVVRGEMRPS